MATDPEADSHLQATPAPPAGLSPLTEACQKVAPAGRGEGQQAGKARWGHRWGHGRGRGRLTGIPVR